MNKEILLTPGPSQVPPEVLMRLSEPVFHHRTPRFKRIYKKVLERLQRIFLTSNETAVLSSSGTGAMEAALVNIVPPGKKVLTIEGGKFGERWGGICDAFGIEHKSIPLEWGKAVDPDDVAVALEEDKDIAAVCATLCETSTGVEHPIEVLGKRVAKTDAVLMVDGVSGAVCVAEAASEPIDRVRAAVRCFLGAVDAGSPRAGPSPPVSLLRATASQKSP